jgi:hypothetical protein
LDAARSIFISAYLAGAGIPVGTEEEGLGVALPGQRNRVRDDPQRIIYRNRLLFSFA